MELKRFFLGLVLAFIPVLSYCDGSYENASNCYSWFDPKKSGGYIHFPDNKSCISLSADLPYITPKTSIVLTRGSYSISASKPGGGANKVRGCDLREILYFFVKPLPDGTEEGPFVYQWNDGEDLFSYYHDSEKKDDVIWSFYPKKQTIDYDKLNASYYKVAEKKLDELGYSSVSIRFQIVSWLKIYRGYGDDESSNRQDKEMSIKGSSTNITFYTCESGRIGAGSTTTPKIEETDGTATYCIYPNPKKSSSDVAIQITNLQGPGYYNTDLYFTWNLYDKYGSNLDAEHRVVNFSDKTKDQTLGTFVNFYYSDLKDYSVGDKYTVARTISLTNQYENELDCQTPSLTFEIVPEAFLSDKEEESVSVCPIKKEINFYGRYELTESDWLNLIGEEIKFRDSDNRIVSISDEMYNAYGISYGWEYSTDKENWILMKDTIGSDQYVLPKGSYNYIRNFLNNPKANPQDLLVPNNMFEEGKTYYFRQVVTLEKFSNRKIVSEKLHEVKAYKFIDESNFTIYPLENLCADGNMHDVNLSVMFTPSKDATLSDYNWASKNGPFIYRIAFLGNNQRIDAQNLNAVYNGSSNEEVVREAKLEVIDGCGTKIELKDSMKFEPQPVLDPASVTCTNAEYRVADGNVQINMPSGVRGYIKISDTDPDFATSKYYYSTDDKAYTEISSHGLEVILLKEDEKRFYVKKQNNYGNRCESQSVEVSVSKIGTIGNNRINDTLYYVCEGSANPRITASTPNGGFGGTQYSYLWLYSNDDAAYSRMEDKKNEVIATQNLEEGVWAEAIDRKYYFKRVVTSRSGNGVLSDTSVAVVVMPYKEPLITFVPETTYVCYGAEVGLNAALDAEFAKQAEKGKMKMNFWYAEKNADAEFVSVSQKQMSASAPSGYEYKVEKDAVLYAMAEVCGSTYSSDGKKITSGDNLEPKMTIGECRVRGSKMAVNVADANPKYTYHINDIEGDAAEIDVPAKTGDNLIYTVQVSDGKCSNTYKEVVDESKLQEAFVHNPITVGGTETGMICAGVMNTFKSTADVNKAANQYLWKNGINTIENSDDKSLTYTLVKPGTDYTLIRLSKQMAKTEVCQSIYDTLRISTYPEVERANISIDKDIVCYDDSLTLTISGFAGSGTSIYSYTIFNDDKEITSEKASSDQEKKHTISLGATGIHEIYAVVSDAQVCINENYKKSTATMAVTQAASAEFTLTATPAIWIPGKEDTEKTFSITATPKNAKDDMSEDLLYHSYGSNPEAKSTGETFSIIASTEDFPEGGNLIVNVTRKVDATECTAKNQVSIALSSGFVDRPGITSDIYKDADNAVVCGGETMTLSLAGIPNFGEKSIDAGDASLSYAWYSNQRLVAKTPTYLAKASAGDTAVYQCKLSYKDSKMTQASSVYSYEFTLIGKKGVKIGNVYKSDDKSRFAYTCLGSAKDITLEADADDSGANIIWEQSADAVTWEAVNEKNIVEKDGTRLTLNGASYSATAGKTYFRVKGISACGTETYSNNIVTLTVQNNPEAPVVALRSRNVIEKGTDVSLAFSPKNGYAGYRYEWGIAEDDISIATDGSAEATLTSKFNIGGNRIYVKKIATTDGMCESALTAFDFSLYEALSIGVLTGNKIEKTRCPKDNEVKLHVSDIMGGSGKYVINWQYKNEAGNWISFGENSITPFSATYVEGAFGDTYQYGLSLTDLSSSIIFRAKIASVDEDGGYIGDWLATNEYALEFYDELQDGGIDTEEMTLCYGGALSNISGSQPKGGDKNYIYQWYRTTTPTEEASWETIPAATSQNYSERDTLFKTTYYKRTVTDGCGSTGKPTLYKHVIVKDAVFIEADAIKYYDVVSDGETSAMWGVPQSNADASQYVWFDENWQVLDTTVVSKSYSTEKLYAEDKDLMNYVYYAKKLDGECMSYNSDTLYVTVFKNTSGTIFVNGTDLSNEDKYWVCSGTTDIEIKSESNPMDASYLWYYSVIEYDGNETYTASKADMIRTKSGAAATGEEINLDTCSLNAMGKSKMVNESGYKMAVEIYRLAKFDVNASSVALESNTVRINIVPTMTSSNKVLRKALVGSLQTENIYYCKGDVAGVVSGEEEFGGDTWNIWADPSSNFGPWLYDEDYDEDGVTTWWEIKKAKEGDYIKRDSVKLNVNGYAQTLSLGELDENYTVRRAVYDGCTSAYTATLTLYVRNQVASLENIEMYAYEAGKTGKYDKFYKGFEIGDSLVIEDKDGTNVVVWSWSLDSLFTEEIEESKSRAGFWIDENYAVRFMQDPSVYLRRKNGDCWSAYLQIPIALGTASKGGEISEYQKVCRNGSFSEIRNIEAASGDWISPEYAKMKWTYTWEWSKDSISWGDIDGAEGIELSADYVNQVVDYPSLTNDNVTYIRRVATNDSARVRYSNVATMSYYEEMKPGVLSDDNNGKSGYCSGEELPIISTTDPAGGTFKENGVSYTWKVSLNGGEYAPLSTKKTSLDLSYVAAINNLTLDENVKVSVVCEYSDGKIGCGTVESEPLDYVLYRRNDAPGIYQDNDSCDAQEVVVKVVPEKIEKTYIFGTFVFTENGDSLTWESEANEKTIHRLTTMIVDQYGVYSIDKETGCSSEYTKFNVDSLPDLSQGALSAPETVCYGEDYTVKGGTVVGGNGEKTYTWQYSYDEVEWETLSNQSDEDLDVVKPKNGISYRRIVSDMCGVDTSNAVHIEVREKIVATKDVLVFNDFKCAGRMYNINTAEGVEFTDTDYYLVWNSATGDTFDTKGMSKKTMEGFEGDSLEMSLTHAVADTAGMICKSEPIKVYAHNAIPLDPEANSISCDNATPCNGRYVEIEGEMQSGAYADKIGYKWHVSADGETWTEQLLKTGKDLSLQAADTMYIRRTAYNGCVYDTSNVVTVIGTKVEEYDYVGNMALEVVSDMQDSSVAMYIERGKEFASNYFLEGDGELPAVSGNTTVLPYKADAYKDSILMLVANSDHCVNGYRVSPLRGGVIRFDGDSVLCGGSDIPAIVATMVEGGNGNYAYQWQYMNIYTADYVDIDGATDKEYTPKAVSVETSYRRKTTDGEYTSLSNVISVSIRPLPKTTDIVPSVSDSVLKAYSLSATQYSVEKLPSMELSLIDSISDADSVAWQRSYDNAVWKNVEMQEANDKGVYEMPVVDTTDVVYYRTVATSACGEHTSKAYKVTTLYASVIMDEELVLKDSVCKGASSVYIKFKKDYPKEYEYSYRTIDYEGRGVYAFVNGGNSFVFSSKEKLTDTTKVSYGAIFEDPKHSFDVEVTRWVKATGARSTKLVHFYVNDLTAKYSYIIDEVESHESGEKSSTVRLNQGSRVVFTPEVSGGLEDKQYKWNLIAPLNVDFYQKYGGNVGREGLTSVREEPVCYFYNKGSYTITMQVTDGMCSSTVSDTAMYIAEATRDYLRSATFDVEEEPEYEEIRHKAYHGVEFGIVEVYPTHFSDKITIFTDYREAQHYEIYNALGSVVKEGDYIQSAEVGTADLIPGAYVVKTAGQVVLVVKSK